MRVMMTVWPATSHLLPAVPLAWALQGAGHEVCFAVPPALADTACAAGQAVVPLDRMGTQTPDYAEVLTEQDNRRYADALGIESAVDAHTWEMFSVFVLPAISMYHPPGQRGQPMPLADDLVDFADAWQPDLVLWDGWPSAAVAARRCRAAHARLLWGPDVTSWYLARSRARAPQLAAAGLGDPLTELVNPVAERFGVTVDTSLLLGDWSVDPTPAEIRLPSTTRTVPMRWVPYTTGRVLPDWVYPQPQRPRVAITLGTTAQMFGFYNTAMISRLLAAVADLDIEVVATLDSAQCAGQEIPDNVRTVDYVSLNQLLPTCSALMHHGGFGSFAAAVAHRVPQLIEMAAGVESPGYATYLADRGAGLALNHGEQSLVEMRKSVLRVLEEPSFQEGADRLHADWLAVPSPNDVVPMLEKLTMYHRNR